MPRVSVLAALIALLLPAGCAGSTSRGAVAPPASASPASGPLGDTWTWDGTTWHSRLGAGPSSREAPALAYDAARGVYVLFGGQLRSGQIDDTWAWDGSAWKQLSPAHHPSARRGSAMAYDPTGHVLVLYGGLVADPNEGHETGDTWTWDGGDWTKLAEGPGPPGVRDGARMVTAGSRVLLFGGNSANIKYYGDAFAWTGTTWVQADVAPRPAGRTYAAVAWDQTNASLFVFGGAGINAGAGPGNAGIPLDDGWTLSGRKWNRITASGPPALALPTALFDQSGQHVVVLLGLGCPNPSAAAWGWDGHAWTALPAPGISARWGAALAQEPDGRALLFGGSDQRGC